jgi:hypothetical protein
MPPQETKIMATPTSKPSSYAAALGAMLTVACDLPEEPVSCLLGGVVSVPLGLDFSPLSMEHGDFDGDAAADVLIGGVSGAGAVVGAVIRGNGDGTLQPPIDAGLNACSAYTTVGNVDGDARTDVVTLGCASNVAVFLAQPDGTLAPWAAWPGYSFGGSSLVGTAIADFESDGDNDVFALRVDPEEGFSAVSIDLSNGNEGFWTQGGTSFRSNTSGFHPTQLLLANLDGDGLIDMVLTDQEHTLARWLGATPQAFAFPLELDVSVAPWLTRVGDMNGDGLDDLVVLSRTDAAVQVLLSAGDGELLPQPPVPLVGFVPYDAALADLDGDGDLDVALVDDANPQLLALRGDGTGGLGDAMQRVLPSGAIRVHAADFDGDGIDDVLAATFADDSLSLVSSTLP